MITFRYVRWKNLLSTGNYFTEIKLNNNTNTLVVGENGSGKSTMLDALCFGLFGKAFRNVNKPNLLNSINGKYIGVKDFNDNQILLENLMSNQYLKLCDDTYGILIPADELLKRTTFGWFVRSSAKQVLKSDTIIGNYLLLYNTPDNKEPLIEPLETNPGWVAFWRTPLYNGLYGLKTKNLGNNMQKVKYPGR